MRKMISIENIAILIRLNDISIIYNINANSLAKMLISKICIKKERDLIIYSQLYS